MDKTFDLYRDIAERTDGDVYIGVVGPVRTGKSTLIARMMEKLVLPAMAPGPRRDRLSDELPQSGSGRTIMTTQPKFVPGEAVTVTLGEEATVRVRMVDSVGYLVEGALGTEEDGAARMVHTPWFDYDIPFEQAAETGTRKVIADHATIGLVVTTDGTVADLPRESYTAAEERVVSELKTLGKPFIVVLNSRTPDSPDAQRLRERLAGRYGVPVMAMNVKEMEVDDIQGMFEQVLFQFPLREIQISVPDWLSALDEGHWLAKHVLEGVRAGAAQVTRVGDHAVFAGAFADSPYTGGLKNEGIDLGQGRVRFSLPLRDGLFNRVLGEECGTEIRGDAHLLAPDEGAGGRQDRIRPCGRRAQKRARDGLRPGDPHDERADLAGAGDRQAGEPLRREAQGQRAVLAPHPRGHRNRGQPRGGHRKAERGAGAIPAGGV